jgi:predicted O-methyltransferase YrrM
MNLITRLLRADDSRKSRFHTASGQLAVSPEVFRALGSTVLRVGLNRYPTIPWITYPAIRFLAERLEGRRLFEFGSGTSTRWYADRCREVFSVENNADWFSMIERRVREKPNTKISLITSDAEFPSSIARVGGKFDAVVVDSQPLESYAVIQAFRIACLRASLQHTTHDCIFIIDNTDAMPKLSEEVSKLFSDRQILRFPGWVPGILHPNETTIVV